uniref:Uncharacterized protein n=1 Tax=Anguilla anguilla TaxID=7936 RepID=A0A0E9VVE9_ANGAN
MVLALVCTHVHSLPQDISSACTLGVKCMRGYHLQSPVG